MENEDLATHITSYFQSMFLAAKDRGPMDFLNYLEGRVFEDMRSNLSRAYTTEEVRYALFQMHPSKALGPDGMLPLFF